MPLILLSTVLVGAQLEDTAAPLLPMGVAIYTLGRWVADLRGLIGLGLIGLSFFVEYLTIDPREHNIGDVFFVTALIVPPYIFGRVVLRMAVQKALIEDREELVTREAVRAERDRIARELHDVVAHSVSAMVVQTAAAQDLVRSDPDKAERVLRDVADTGRRALVETGRLLHVIRDEADELGLAPTPGMADLEDLVGRVPGRRPRRRAAAGRGPARRCRPASTSRPTASRRRRSRTRCATATAPHRCTSPRGFRRRDPGVQPQCQRPHAARLGTRPARHRRAGLPARRDHDPRRQRRTVRARRDPSRGPGLMGATVVIADDQELVRSGLRMVLEARGVDVVGDAPDGRRAVELVSALVPDVVLMDIRMPVLDGIAATREIAARNLATKVLILTTYDVDSYVYGALQAGASGFLLKATAPDRLVAGIETVCAGEALLSPSLTRRLIEHHVRGPAPSSGVPASLRHAHRAGARGPRTRGARARQHRDRRDASSSPRRP